MVSGLFQVLQLAGTISVRIIFFLHIKKYIYMTLLPGSLTVHMTIRAWNFVECF